jgi:hypothetical protein
MVPRPARHVLHLPPDCTAILFSDAAKPFDEVLIASLIQRWMMNR